MARLPKIHVTKKGKKYFIFDGRKVYINSKLTKREIGLIYKLLQKHLAVSTNQGIININNQQARRINSRLRKTKEKPFVSTIDEARRVSVSSGHPKDSGDKDLINSLKNELNKATQLIQSLQPSPRPPPQPQPQPHPPRSICSQHPSKGCKASKSF